MHIGAAYHHLTVSPLIRNGGAGEDDAQAATPRLGVAKHHSYFPQCVVREASRTPPERNGDIEGHR
jgi:hypothetical protein